MKKLLQIIGLLFCIAINAQAPEKFSYQAVIRNASNALITNANVGMKISILKNSATGAVVYSESQTVATNANGLISLQIGSGTIISGTISGINWATDSYYLKTETDPAGGTNYTIAGTSQLLSVPYAMYAKSAGSDSPLIQFSSLGGSSQSIAAGTVTTINSWTGLEESGGANYNSTTGEYTIPVTGFYSVSSQIGFSGIPASNGGAEVIIIKNGAFLKFGLAPIVPASYYPFLHASMEMKLLAGDKISIGVDHSLATPLSMQANLSSFAIHLIHK